MKQRAQNTILAALRYWAEALSGARTIPTEIMDVAADDGDRLTSTATTLLANEINEEGIRLMTDDHDMANPIFTLIDTGFAVTLDADSEDSLATYVMVERNDPGNRAIIRVTVHRRDKVDVVLALVARAMTASQ